MTDNEKLAMWQKENLGEELYTELQNKAKPMTDNEIVKALEYWKQFNKDIDTLQSTHPQYADMWDEQKEVVKITFEVFESFNRQKAEIEAFINGQETLQKYIAEQKAEIERLKRKLVAYEPSVDSGLFSQMLLEQKEKAEAFEKKWKAEIKSEAYREFAERSEKELFIKQNEHREHWMETLNRHRGTEAYKDHEWSIDNWLRGYGEAVQDILGINQKFLKELVGEDDG